MNQVYSTILCLLLTFRISYAQGETVNVCGRTYQEAEANCPGNPQCSNLQCPNKYWEEGGVLMKCFSVPLSKCNFGPPAPVPEEVIVDISTEDTIAVMSAPSATFEDVPLSSTSSVEVDLASNTNYCGPVYGGWQVAVDNCSQMTACPGGSTEECEDGYICYAGVVCDPSNKEEIVFDVTLDGDEIVSVSNVTQGTDYPATELQGTQDGPEEAVVTLDSNETTMSSNTNVSAKDPAQFQEAVSNSTEDDKEPAPFSVLTSYDSDILVVPTPEETGAVEVYSVKPTSSDISVSADDTSTVVAEFMEATQNYTYTVGSSNAVPIVESDTNSYCGPDAAEGRKRALALCSPSTMCGADRICPDDMVCYSEIQCGITNDSPPSMSSPTTLASLDTATSSSTVVPTVSVMNDHYYCGPNPAINDNAWQVALETCSQETSCTDRPCPTGQICFGGIDCLAKLEPESNEATAKDTTTFTPSTEQTTAATTTPKTTTSITTTTSTTSTKAKPVNTQDTLLEINTSFYCGPVTDDGWLKASELCVPCHNGDPNLCGVGMTCYSGVTCSKPKSTADEMLLEVEERVHIGYCGVNFYESRENCKQRRPCTLDQDCDAFHPQCFAVSCEDEESPPATSLGTSGMDDTIVNVRASFCGAWYEEADSQCATRPPCKTANDCGVEHTGCFSDISCKFTESSAEYQDFLTNLELLEEAHANIDTNGMEAGAHSNLRPRPATTTYDARNGSTMNQYHLHLLALIIPVLFSWIL